MQVEKLGHSADDQSVLDLSSGQIFRKHVLALIAVSINRVQVRYAERQGLRANDHGNEQKLTT